MVCDTSHSALRDSHKVYKCHLVDLFNLAVAIGSSTQVDGGAGFRIMLVDMPDRSIGVNLCREDLKTLPRLQSLKKNNFNPDRVFSSGVRGPRLCILSARKVIVEKA